MFANVHTKKFKLLYVVTDKRTKLNIDFVHDVGLLKFDKNAEVFKNPVFVKRSRSAMINIARTKNSWKKVIFGSREIFER